MKMLMSFVVMILMVSVSNAQSNSTPMSTPVKCTRDLLKPMLGCGVSYKEIAADQAFVRKAKLDDALKAGWEAFYSGDLPGSIERFNQAWLINRNDYRPLWAFGTWTASQKKIAESLTYFRLAAAQNPKDAAFNTDYGRVLTISAVDAKTPSLFTEAEKVFEAATKIDPKNAGAWSQWAVMEYQRGDYAASWKKVKKAESLNKALLPSTFIEALTEKMKRPRSALIEFDPKARQ